MIMASESAQPPQLVYTYTALDHSKAEIRLVRVYPAGNKTAELKCDLFHSALSEIAGQYFALSYVWGIANDKVVISLKERRFEITRDLAAALRHLRRNDASVDFWIDSICINQTDNAERTHQVQCMRDIYSQAARVYAWLDEPKPVTQEAWNFVRELANRTAFHDRLRVTRETKSWLTAHIQASQCSFWSALGELMQRPYWTRTMDRAGDLRGQRSDSFVRRSYDALGVLRGS
jgi:hypothetical protein